MFVENINYSFFLSQNATYSYESKNTGKLIFRYAWLIATKLSESLNI